MTPSVAKAFKSVLAAAAIFGATVASGAALGGEKLVVGVTTSSEASGLFAHLAPLFEQKTGIRLRAVVAGTGQLLRIARTGDVDVIFTHDPESELAFVAEGYGVERREVMCNDFVIVGPEDDPAAVRGSADAALALQKIAGVEAIFLSRGDESGTHRAEKRLWQAAGIDPAEASGRWYLETGSGQGVNLNIAAGRGAYTLTDRGTWIGFRNRGELMILVEGDTRLENQYGVILVSPEKHAHVNAAAGLAFIDWITSPEGQDAIADYRVGGEQLFFPNHGSACPVPSGDALRALSSLTAQALTAFPHSPLKAPPVILSPNDNMLGVGLKRFHVNG